MFTGIIESTAKVIKTMKTGLALERPKIFSDIKIGSSIAVSGVCLSVVAFDKQSMTFDVVPTTLRKTKLGLLKKGDLVNLERAMKADARFEGHIVTGHVEGVGGVHAHRQGLLTIAVPSSLSRFIVPHGSITLDGVSLTVASLTKNQLIVALIPHTLEHSTLGFLRKGDHINIETDILAKYVLSSHS